MEIEKELSRQDAIFFLRQIADALEDKKKIYVDDNTISISPNTLFSIEYEEEGDECELEVELKWSNTGKQRVGTFEIFEGRNAYWYFRLKGANGQTILSSQKYKSRIAAEKGVASVRKNAIAQKFEFCLSQADQPYFILKAQNGEIIGTSQMYKRRSGCEKGAKSVLINAAAAEIRVLESAE